MVDFNPISINSVSSTSERVANQPRNNMTVSLEIIEAQIRLIKNLILRDTYYKSVIDELIVIQTNLDRVAYILLEENVKKCLAERIQSGNEEAVDRILVSTGRLIKM